jgi:hypothetical protein
LKEDMMIQLLDPKAQPVVGKLVYAARPNSLAKARVGILWNGRTHGDGIMKRVVSLLDERYGVELVKVLKKAYIGNVAPAAFFEEMATLRLDAAVVGVGD